MSTYAKPYALWIASEKGHKEVCEVLLKHNASLDHEKTRAEIKNPLKLFTHLGNVYEMTPMEIAEIYGHVGIAEVLINHYDDTKLKSLLLNPFKDRWVSIVTIILNHNVDVNVQNAQGHTPLVLTILHHPQESDLCEKFVHKGADVNIRDQNGYLPIHHAITNAPNIVKKLLEARSDINERCIYTRCPLVHAISWNADEQLIKELLDHGALVNYEDINAMTPVALAINKKRLDIVELLLDYGAKPDLFQAAEAGLLNVVNRTEDWQQIRHQTDFKGETLLHKAYRSGCEALVKYLIEKRFDANAVNIWGRTPIQEALCWGVEIPSLMDPDKLQISVVDINGWTLHHVLAREAGMECKTEKGVLYHDQQVMSQKDNHGMTAFDHTNYGKKLYHKDEHPCGDILANMLPTDKRYKTSKDIITGIRTSNFNYEVLKYHDAHQEEFRSYAYDYDRYGF